MKQRLLIAFFSLAIILLPSSLQAQIRFGGGLVDWSYQWHLSDFEKILISANGKGNEVFSITQKDPVAVFGFFSIYDDSWGTSTELGYIDLSEIESELTEDFQKELKGYNFRETYQPKMLYLAANKYIKIGKNISLFLGAGGGAYIGETTHLYTFGKEQTRQKDSQKSPVYFWQAGIESDIIPDILFLRFSFMNAFQVKTRISKTLTPVFPQGLEGSGNNRLPKIDIKVIALSIGMKL